LRVGKADKVAMTINGKAKAVKQDGEFVIFGDPPARDQAPPAKRPTGEDPVEQRATVHYFFLPEEVHLRAGSAKETEMRLRCVGRGEAQGELHFVAPNGISVEPASVQLGHMKEGDEKTVQIRIKAATDAANALHKVRVESVGNASSSGSLLVSVGVVMTEDKRVPTHADFVIRAPGYTMRVDQTSGVSYYLLDADGNRRHGFIHNTNFCFGIPALASGEDQWIMRYRLPCQFFWDTERTLTVGPGNGEGIRFKYTFHEDRIVIGLVSHPPNDPKREYTMWLGNFDSLGQPRQMGTCKLPESAPAAEWLYYPHPIHRQGVLLGLPEKTSLGKHGGGTAVSLPILAGQEVVLRFASEEEVKELFKEDKATPEKKD
jgi:hypothetical protein